MNWIQISNLDEVTNSLKSIEADPANRFIIFKHSTRCGTSSMAKKMFEKYWKETYPVFLVHVIENRNLSNLIEKKYGVKHESPQLLLINEDTCIYHASHSNIDANELIKQISK